MKRQRANRRAAPIASYRGKGRWEWMQLALAGALALAGLVLVIVRVWGMRFSGFLLLGIAALLAMNVLLDRLTAENSRWRLARCYLFTDITVLVLSLSYIPVKRIAFSLITVTISSFLIDKIQDFHSKDAPAPDGA